MFTFILISLILLPVVSLPLALSFFSSTELDEMGIRMENIDETPFQESCLHCESLQVKMMVA